MRWSYILTRRFRWKNLEKIEVGAKAFKELKVIAGDKKIGSILRDANLVEVRIPFVDEETSWEARIAPWEFLLSNAALGFENHKPLAIVRHLQTGAPELPFEQPPRVLFVQCAPGILSEYYSYESELAILKQMFPDEHDVVECINPSLSELRTVIEKEKPNLIHIAGIDNNQARHLEDEQQEKRRSRRKPKDGIVFRSNATTKGYKEVPAETLARTLNASSGPLYLVTVNVYHSAARICSMAVAEGAHLAIGFQDTVNDAVAEVFLREFYSVWRRKQSPLSAFSRALDVVRDTISLTGTGIVLWSAHSLLRGANKLMSDARHDLQEARNKPIGKEELENFREWFKPEIKVKKTLNFSVLHNNSGGLFDKFWLIKKQEGLLHDVGIEAVLFLDSQSHAFRRRCTLRNESTPIEEVKVPLTSSIIRTVSEPLRTSLFVEVRIGDLIAHQETYQVTLNPADEWIDDDTNRVWLPSFVLPRDPFISDIIDRAEKHLITLTDNRNSSFDGYQQVGLSEDQKKLKVVDLQVQAIWAAIIFDFGIGYINPPPSGKGQRLRTPTQIQRGGRGTCIDLALMFAACLEYIDINPVIILIEGHAFVGYWKSQERYNQFMAGTHKNVLDADGRGMSQEASPWVFLTDNHAEIKKEVDEDFLVPLETVDLTEEGKFSEAKKKGKRRLDNEVFFNALIDISLARAAMISPLPIIEGLGNSKPH